MKSTRFYILFFVALFAGQLCLFAQTTAFTYQGSLNLNGVPANGAYDLMFSLFGTNLNGAAGAGPVTNSLTSVSNGLFTTSIDFGAAISVATNKWLEIAVRTNGANSFVILTPRQQLTPTPYAIVAGGLASVANGNSVTLSNNAAVGGGFGNIANDSLTTVGGGYYNLAQGLGATVSGGSINLAGTNYATVSGGDENQALSRGSTVAGGEFNTASDTYDTVGGGYQNTASGSGSTVPGGVNNVAGGFDSFAAGNNAHANTHYSFVWNDGSAGAYSSTADYQFCIHAKGGIVLAGDMQMGASSADYHHFTIGGGNSYGYLYGSYPGLGDGIHMGYNYYYDPAGTGHTINTGGATSRISTSYGDIQLATGNVNAAPIVRLEITATTVTVKNATFNNSSDRNLKQDFADVSPSEILNKVLELPVSEWSYNFDSATRHIGPVAQDFYSAFNIGTDDKHIAPIDEGGIAFAAIKGLNQKLNQKLEEKEAEIQKLAAEIEELKQAIKAK